MLDKILQLTDAVEACIEQGDWLEASQINARRQALLVELCNDRPLDEKTREVLREVLQRNQSAEVRLRGRRGQVAGAASRLTKNRDAMQAYQRNSLAVRNG